MTNRFNGYPNAENVNTYIKIFPRACFTSKIPKCEAFRQIKRRRNFKP